MLAALLRQLVSRRRGSALGHKAGVRRLHLGCGTYTRADYGYRGDWRTTNIVLTMDSARHGGKSPDELFETIRTQRNVVVEMIATLRAVKPARVPGGTKADSMSVAIEFLAATDSKAEHPRPQNCAPTPPSLGAT